jgi:pilus assembly protein CpaE
MPEPSNLLPASWKPLVISPHADIARRIMAALSQTPPVCFLPEYPRMGTATGLAESKGGNICFLDVATNAEHAQLLISELSPSMPVVGLHLRNDADLILRCLRRGASESLSEFTPEALRGVFDRLGKGRTLSAKKPGGSIWCVAPGKPGAGASTLAANLAIRIHSGGGPVLLVDADPLSASVAFLLKLKPEFHLGDVVRDWNRMDNDLWGRLTVTAAGIDVLAAPEDPGIRLEIGRQAANEMCAFWRERYQAVVIDTGDVRSAVDTGFAAIADLVLLVTTNELSALQSTRRAIGCLDQAMSGRSRLRLLLNRYTPLTGLKREDVEKVLSVEPFATLGNDYETLQTAMLEGRPAATGSRYGVSVDSLCRQLFEQPAAPSKSKSKTRGASWLTSLLAHK